MSNLLVIQHLEILYLGENHVRVVCVRVWKKLKKGLATGSRDWRVAKGGTRVKHAGELKSHASCCTTGQNFQSGQVVNSWLVPVVSSSRQNILFGCNWFFAFHTHPTINTLISTKCREFRERIFEKETLKKKKIDSSTIFILWFSKFFNSHPLHW